MEHREHGEHHASGESSGRDLSSTPIAADHASAQTDVTPAPSRSDSHGGSTWRAFRDPLIIGILIAALVADQVTKQIVLNSLGPGTSWPDDGFFRFTFVRNDGTAFGFFQGNGTILTFVSVGAVALIIYFYREAAMASWFTRSALGLQLGGAAGNLIDRFRHGYVVDFIDVGPWPIFNIADSAIITGIVGLVAYFTLLGGRDQQIRAGHATGDAEAGASGTLDMPQPVLPTDEPPVVGTAVRPESRD
ncbi:MAG: signal peptidase II [Chloroflexi bacterium]|nr:signal peptidase II [Chloroflexota bacterium]